MKQFGITAKQAAENLQRAARAGNIDLGPFKRREYIEPYKDVIYNNPPPDVFKRYILRKERRFAIMRIERSIGNLIKPIVIPILNFLNKLL